MQGLENRQILKYRAETKKKKMHNQLREISSSVLYMTHGFIHSVVNVNISKMYLCMCLCVWVCV